MLCLTKPHSILKEEARKQTTEQINGYKVSDVQKIGNVIVHIMEDDMHGKERTCTKAQL